MTTKDEALKPYWLCCGSTNPNQHREPCTDKYVIGRCKFGTIEDHRAPIKQSLTEPVDSGSLSFAMKDTWTEDITAQLPPLKISGIIKSEPADERESFEAAMNEMCFFPRELSFARTKSPSGRDEYANSHLQSCWIGWQAEQATRKSVPEWVSVKDRLPAPYDTVLGYVVSGGLVITDGEDSMMDTVCYSDDRKSWLQNVCDESEKVVVTHWMPLPAAPKE